MSTVQARTPIEAFHALRRGADPRRRPALALVLAVALIAGGTVGLTLGVTALLPHPAGASGGNGSLVLGLGSAAPSSPARGLYWESMAVTGAPRGLRTSLFALALHDATGDPVTPAPVPSGCSYSLPGTSFDAASCPAPTMGWFAVLYWIGNGSIANTFGGASGTASSPPLPVTTAERLVLVSGTDLEHSADRLSVVSLGSPRVTGMCGPF